MCMSSKDSIEGLILLVATWKRPISFTPLSHVPLFSLLSFFVFLFLSILYCVHLLF